MKKAYVLYNPLSGDRCGKEKAEKVCEYFSGEECVVQDITALKDFDAFAEKLASEDEIVVCGGDGTLNRFINDTLHLKLRNPLFYYATGSGNDFLRDIGAKIEDGPVRINCYVENLPTVTVNGKTYRFINGVGYGIDGYCCEVGDELRCKGKKPNYTTIAITGLLFHYKATNAKVTVDGKTYTYNKVWIAPTMNGRYYGGGMMPVPDQDRNDPNKGVAVMVMHNAGRIGTLCVFPSIFTGKHIERRKKVSVHRGHDITVEFDRPVTLQIDGETILNVTKYHACSAVPVKK